MSEIPAAVDLADALARANQRLRTAYDELEQARASQLRAEKLQRENAVLNARLSDSNRQLAELVVELETRTARETTGAIALASPADTAGQVAAPSPGGLPARLRRRWQGLLLRRRMKQIRRSGLFDVAWYLMQNPDVAAARMDPIEHYLLFGCREGRQINPYIDLGQYVARNPEAYADPLRHLLGKRGKV